MQTENAAQQFDHDKAQQLISDIHSMVTTICPSGAMEWIEKNRPDVADLLNATAKEIDRAFECEDEPGLSKALDVWRRYHLRAFELFAARPPVIEL